MEGPYSIARRIMKEHPGFYNNIESGRQSVARIQKKVKQESAIVPAPASSGAVGRLTEADLRRKHDIGYIVRLKAAEIEKGVFYPEADFIRLSGIKVSSGYRTALDHPDLTKYKGRAGGVTYWGHPESIRKMKDETILI